MRGAINKGFNQWGSNKSPNSQVSRRKPPLSYNIQESSVLVMVTSFGFLLLIPCPTLKQFLVLAQKKGCILEDICEIDTEKKKKKNPHNPPQQRKRRLFKASVYPKKAVGLAWWWKGRCVTPGILQCLCGENWTGKKREAEGEGGRNLKGIPPLLEFWWTTWPHRLCCSQHYETHQLC